MPLKFFIFSIFFIILTNYNCRLAAASWELEPEEFMQINLDDPSSSNEMSPHPSYSSNWLGVLLEAPAYAKLSLPTDKAVTDISEKLPLCLYLCLPLSEFSSTLPNINIPEEETVLADLSSRSMEPEFFLKDIDTGRIISFKIPSGAGQKMFEGLALGGEIWNGKETEDLMSGYANYNLSEFITLPVKNAYYLIWIKIGNFESNRSFLRIELEL